MKLLRVLLAAALASAWPSSATAAVAEAARIAPAARAPSIAAPQPALFLGGNATSVGAPSLLTPSPSLPSLPLAAPVAAAATPLPSTTRAVPIRAVAPVETPTAHERLSAAAEAVAQARESAAPASSESSSASSRIQFDLLLGAPSGRGRAVAYADGPAAPRPSGLAPATTPEPLDPEKAKRVRGMFAGTAAMKIGMETVTLSIPLLALQAMGGATLMAGLLIVYGIAQAAFAGGAASLIDRAPAPKVLAGAVVSQAALIAAIIALGATGLLTPMTLFPLYLLVGGAVGIAETARHSIPPLILGQDEEALSRYNARLHIFYETAGVIGALATAGLITFVGPLWALALQPPAYLLGGFLFWRVKLAERSTMNAGFAMPSLANLRERLAEYVADMKAGARLVMKNDRLRWVAVAFVLPQIVHRILEGMLAPIFAKRVLMNPGAAGYLMTASNMGELLGAFLLLRYAAKIKAPRWVKWGALAMLASWLMVFTHALPFVLPVILLMSMTWSASDLSLRSEVQSSLDEKDQPRATSFLYGSFVLGAAAASLGLGALFDLLPVTFALAGVFALFTALGVAVFHASRRLSVKKH